MTSMKRVMILLAGATMLSATGAAQATDHRTTAGGAWSQWQIWEKKTGNTWTALTSTDPVPGASDVAIIRHNVGVDGSRTCDGLQVDSGVTLSFDSDDTLVLDGGTATSPINGTIDFSASAVSGPVLTFSGTQTLSFSSGQGLIKGPDAAQQVQIGTQLTINSGVAFEGAMTIMPTGGTATFVMNGRVEANLSAKTLYLHSGLILGTASSGTFRVSGFGSAVLEFGRSADLSTSGSATLNVAGGGDVWIDNGVTVDFDVLDYDQGLIDFRGASGSITFDATTGSACGTLPSSPLSVDFSGCP